MRPLHLTPPFLWHSYGSVHLYSPRPNCEISAGLPAVPGVPMVLSPLVSETRADPASHSKQYHLRTIKSARSILGLTLGLWKLPFSQAQHPPSLQSDATLPAQRQSAEEEGGGGALLSCSHFINLTDVIAVFSGGHPEARSRGQGGAAGSDPPRPFIYLFPPHFIGPSIPCVSFLSLSICL